MRRIGTLSVNILAMGFILIPMACDSGPQTVTPDQFREFHLRVPLAENVVIGITAPSSWTIIETNDREAMIMGADAISEQATVVQFGRIIDYMGFEDGTTSMLDYYIDLQEEALNDFTVTSTTRLQMGDSYAYLVAFQHEVASESISGLGYVFGNPYGLIISANSLSDPDAYDAMLSMLESIRLETSVK